MKQFLRYTLTLIAILMVTTNAWAAATCHTVTKSTFTTDATYKSWGITYYYYSQKQQQFLQINDNGYATISSVTFTVTGDQNDDAQKFRILYNTGSGWQYYDDTEHSLSRGSLWEGYPAGTKNITLSNSKIKNATAFGIEFTNFNANGSGDRQSRTLTISNVSVSFSNYFVSYANGTTLEAFPSTEKGKTCTTKRTFNYQYNNTITSVNWTTSNSMFTISSSHTDDCSGEGTVTISFTPSEIRPEITGTITGTANTGQTITVNVVGSSWGKEDPTYTWNSSIWNGSSQAREIFVGETIDNILSYTSSQANCTYSIEKLEDFGINNGDAITTFANNQLIAGRAGKYKLTVTQPEYSIDATSGYNAGTTSIIINIQKRTLTAHISQSTAVWNERIENPFSFTTSPNNEKTIVDYEIINNNPYIAKYDVNTNAIQTYYTSGDANFTISRPEDYKYNVLSQTRTLTVKAKTESCDIFSDPTERDFSTGITDFSGKAGYSYEIPENARAYTDSVYITAKRNGENYFYLQYSIDGGNQWNDFPEGELDLSTNYKTFGLKIPDNTIITHIRPFAKTGATLKKEHKDFRVTRKTFITPQINGEEFYLTQTSIRMNFEGTFMLDWSTCTDEIILSCDHPSFVITPSRIDASEQKSGSTPITITCRDENATNLVGKVTIYDQTQKADFNVLCKYLMQRIVWNQYFNNLDADEAGNITFQQVLNAYAATIDGTPTDAPITYTLDENAKKIARLETSNGITTLYITGQGDGKITASIPSIEKDGKIYSADQVTHDIRVRKLGDLCNTNFPLKDRIELHTIQTSEAFDIHEMNAGTLLFTAHRDILGGNEFYVQFSSDYQTSWTDKAVALEGDKDKDFIIPIPNGTTHLRFATKTGATLKKYIKQIRVTQKMELKPDTKQINETIYVNTPYEKNIQVAYSDVPIIQTSLTQNTTDQLLLTTNQPITNNCGEFGTYIYTLSGEWTQPQTITEILQFFTSAGLPQTVNITIHVILDEQNIVSIKDGSWSDPSTWSNGTVPQAYHNVQVEHQLSIDTHVEVHSLIMTQGASLHITSQGGLNIHAGGYSTSNNTADITLDNLKTGAGYLRISPEYTGTMPKVNVRYQTRSTLDTGANKDATWQYIGAPGANCQFTVDYITWLYQWSEPQNWLQQSGTLTLSPFAGYAITQYGQPTYELTAEAITADRTITLTKTPNGMNGDNLFANSYMAPIDAKNFTPEDFSDYGTGREDIEKTFYVFNSGSWNEWNKYNSLGQTIGSNGSTTPGQYCAIPALSSKYLNNTYDITTIPPMQGVYVIAKNNNAAIYLNYQKHVWRAGSTADLSTDMHEPMRAPSHNAYQLDNFRRLRIQINSANSGADRMYVIQDTITTTDYDNGYDAPNQLAEGLANIYTNEHFGQMEVSCSNHIDSTFVGFTAGLDSIYTLRFNAIIGDDLHLLDLDNDSIILLEEDATYTFHATPHSKNDLRFQILLHPEKNLDFGEEEKDEIYTGITDVHTTQVWSHGSCIYINNVPANTIATLYNISGHKLLTTPIHHTPYTLDLSYLPKGVYMLQLNTNVYKFVIQ